MSRLEDNHIYKLLNPDEQDRHVRYEPRHTPGVFTKMNSAPEIKETIKARQERVEQEDKAIEYYLEVYEREGREQANAAFWNIYK